MTAEFEPGTLEKYKHIAARKISQKAKIPGFRPGKAPYEVILRAYGEKAIEEEAIETMVEGVYPSILDEAKINPGAPGSLEEVISTEPVKLSFIIPLEPTVELGDYRAVREEYSLEAVTDKQVDDFITRMMKNYATAEPVNHPAADGDLVALKLDVTLAKPADEEKAEVLKDSPLQVIIGENDPEENDFPYVGFSDELKGLSENEEKTFKYTYPEDSKYDRLRGKEAEFHVTVQNVKSLVLPELNDEFAQTLGNFENVAKLRDTVRQQLETQKKADYDEGYFDRVIDKLAEKAVIKYPPQLLQDEIDHTLEHIQEDLAQQKLELDVYLKTLKKDREKWLEEEIKPVARKRLERSLLLDEIAKTEKLEVGNEELNTEFNNLVYAMQGQQDFKKMQHKLTNEKLANAIAMQAATRVLNQHVRDRMKEIATGHAPDLEKKAEEAPAAAGETPAKPKRAARKKTEDQPASEAVAQAVKPAAKPKSATKKKAVVEPAAADQPAETPKPKRAAKKSADA